MIHASESKLTKELKNGIEIWSPIVMTCYTIEIDRSMIWTNYLMLKTSYSLIIKGGRMGRSDTVSLWCVSLLINTRFRFFILE